MEVRSSYAASPPPSSAPQPTRRRLIIRDSVKFLTLTACTVVLAGVTTALFRSFESRREELAVRWGQRGLIALQQGHSAQAVEAMRTSLTYKPDSAPNQLALAQALAAEGHTTEAENYFVDLLQARPGDGAINLQLARLERSRGKASSAIEYYRAAVFGTWGGDAVEQRRATRLELSQYLVERGQMESAQAELLVVSGNNPDAPTQLAVGQLLDTADDPKGALTAYGNAAKNSVEEPVANAKAGELCYRLGDYTCASSLLTRALRSKEWTADQVVRMTTTAKNAERLQQLAVSQNLPLAIRTAHLLDDADIAQARLKTCSTAQADSSTTALQPLQAHWKALDTPAKRAALRHDEDLQDEYTGLIDQTENTVTYTCGAPTGDDALLVYLYAHPMTNVGAQ